MFSICVQTADGEKITHSSGFVILLVTLISFQKSKPKPHSLTCMQRFLPVTPQLWPGEPSSRRPSSRWPASI